ncbi:hypothetical protein [Nocardia africana]|uniref:Uncharacterized protein n=1 Tax=Nocardia africana TaxID=134964 RepID=A0A378X026_9NOCA|nr:hypothetical protein [Nocardia africana]MCC3312652.1 hypothetical protein [Nocardia africana]SUA46024.1 Uncharacterised protein [Nocardia africana]
MVSHDVIAQLRQDITTASDAGDEAEVQRLQRELDTALQAYRESGDDDAERGAE